MIEHHKHFSGDKSGKHVWLDVVAWIERVDDKLNEIIRVVNDLSVPAKKKPLLKELRNAQAARSRLDVKINQLSMELGDETRKINK